MSRMVVMVVIGLLGAVAGGSVVIGVAAFFIRRGFHQGGL